METTMPGISEPTTVAGRALLALYMGKYINRDTLGSGIRAIEAEAGEQAVIAGRLNASTARSLAAQLAERQPSGVAVTVIHRCTRCIPSTVLPSALALEQHIKWFHEEPE
jgi:hypothetical protein